MSFKSAFRQAVPASLLGFYHWLLAWAAALAYGLPARKLVVVGVTGTKGKSSTAGMLWHILLHTGIKTGLISTAQIAVGSEHGLNDLKMTMPGRGQLQALLKRMVRAGCTHVVIETSSEGLAQSRHVGIPYTVAVFTNLAPEHLEVHKSFGRYRAAKGKLFACLRPHSSVLPAAVVNLDDAEAEFFLRFPIKRKLGFTLTGVTSPLANLVLKLEPKQFTPHSARFAVQDQEFELKVGGLFNVYNAAAAVLAAAALGVKFSQALEYVAGYPGTPGRLEFIQTGKPFEVVVDYAHTPESLEAVYKTLSQNSRLVAVLGSCGGGRDKAKRTPLGKLAGNYARVVIVTNEDPYDEDPRTIMESVAAGARQVGKREGESLLIIEDRRAAIRKALELAGPGDCVVITGKGSEQWLMTAKGKKIPWDDRRVVREELAHLV